MSAPDIPGDRPELGIAQPLTRIPQAATESDASWTVGVLTVVLRTPGCSSLKDKRQVLKSLIDRTRRTFNVSIAEVGDQDRWRQATLAIATVANNPRFLNRLLDSLLDKWANELNIEISGVDMELV